MGGPVEGRQGIRDHRRVANRKSVLDEVSGSQDLCDLTIVKDGVHSREDHVIFNSHLALTPFWPEPYGWNHSTTRTARGCNRAGPRGDTAKAFLSSLREQ